ncbi:membrane protein [Beggiatoa sp. PS]|nr:membrane protein [Beggiatoa sp. PS]
MIKLNLTSNEFIAILNELAKTIDMRPVSNEVLHSKADIVRQYGHDDFVRLLDGLKNNELTEPSEWFQAIQYLYHNDELQFVDEENIVDEVKKLLIPFNIKLNRISNATQFLALTVFGGCFFFFSHFVWWEAILFAVLSFLFLVIAKEVFTIFKEIVMLSTINEFFALFLRNNTDHYTVIKILTQLGDNPHTVKLYNTLKSLGNKRINDGSDSTIIRKVIDRIITSTENTIKKTSLIGRLLFYTLPVIIVELFLLYGLNWQTIIYSLGISILWWAFFTIIVRLYKKKAIESGKVIFLSAFPYKHSQHEEALEILKEKGHYYKNIFKLNLIEGIWGSIVRDDLNSKISKVIQELTNTHQKESCSVSPLEKTLKKILVPFDAKLKRLSRFKNSLTLIVLAGCFFCFFHFAFGRAIYLSGFLGLSLLVARLILSHVEEGIVRSARNMFLLSFPMKHVDYSAAFKMLLKLKMPNHINGKVYELLKVFDDKSVKYYANIPELTNDMRTEIHNILSSAQETLTKKFLIIYLSDYFLLAIMLGLFFVYGFNLHSIFYGLGILGLYILFYNTIFTVYTKKIASLAKDEFLSVFPYNHPQHEKALNVLKEMAEHDHYKVLSDKPESPKAEKFLKKWDYSSYKNTKLNFIEKLLEFISKSKPPTYSGNHKDRIETDVQNILVSIDETINRLSTFNKAIQHIAFVVIVFLVLIFMNGNNGGNFYFMA